MSLDLITADATAIAHAVRHRQTTAEAILTATLSRIQDQDLSINSFTAVMAETALAQAQAIDRGIAAGQLVGPLAGVPFAVKNLFDVAGLPTLAGSKINAENPVAIQDATAVATLRQAGAVLVGTLNMDEYAYGFVTENAHYGPTHNPHDLTRIAGGSSGGSAAAVAAGLVPLSLGTDTNGSIRVPAALCGVFGFKPTYGRISRAGVFPLSPSLDHVGPFARSVRDLALVFDLLQGPDPRDPVCSQHEPTPCLPHLQLGLKGLRIGVAIDYFQQEAEPAALAAVEQVAQVLGADQTVILPESQRARAAAFVITATEGGALHLGNLRTRPQDFDLATRERFLAGALIPAQWYVQAQRFRSWYRQQVRRIWQTVDVILAPTTPCATPKIGQEMITLGGKEFPVRANLGLYTQPLSFIGLPVLSVPIQQPEGLPLGVQLIAAPHNEAIILRVAAVLEAEGLVVAPVANV